MTALTRSDYMEERCTFEDYYRAVNATAGLVVRDAELLERVRRALRQGDEHLNTIPLAFWDSRAFSARGMLSRAFKVHGDFWSLGGGVCCVKQAARDAAELTTPKG